MDEEGLMYQSGVESRDRIVGIGYLVVVGSHIDGRILYIIYV